jgi:hypothetical protein
VIVLIVALIVVLLVWALMRGQHIFNMWQQPSPPTVVV